MKESGYKIIKDNRKLLILLITVLCLILIDQIVKFSVIKNIYKSEVLIISGVLNLTYVENTGGAFGIGNNSTIIFIIVNIIVLTLITAFIVLKKSQLSMYGLIGLGLILAGGIGNLIDRVFRGFVIDYIDFNPLIRYPVFNIADIFVVVGCMIIGIGEINEQIRNKN